MDLARQRVPTGQKARKVPYQSRVFYQLEKNIVVLGINENGRRYKGTSTTHLGRNMSKRIMRDNIVRAREQLASSETLRLMHGSKKIADIDAWLHSLDNEC